MNDESRTIPLPIVLTFTLWSVAIGTLIAAWVVALVGPLHIATMLGFTACILTGMAAVVSIGCFAHRTRSLIRTVHTLSGVNGLNSRGPELHPIR